MNISDISGSYLFQFIILPELSLNKALEPPIQIQYKIYISACTTQYQQYYQMEKSSRGSVQHQPTDMNESSTFFLDQQVIRLERLTVSIHKKKLNHKNRSNSLKGQQKNRKQIQMDEKLRLAGKGMRIPIQGEMPTEKMIEDYRKATTKAKKGLFFLCC